MKKEDFEKTTTKSGYCGVGKSGQKVLGQAKA
jgi:hypothetical protein